MKLPIHSWSMLSKSNIWIQVCLITSIQSGICLLGASSYAFSNAQGSIFQSRFRKPPFRAVSLELNPQNQINTAFRIAVRENRLDDAQKLLLKGAEINSTSPEGHSALMYASRNCSTKSVRFLLGRGADLNIKDNDGRTALIYATRESCLKVVQLILDSKNIDIGVRDTMQRTALDYAMNASLLEVDGPANTIVKLLEVHRSKL